MGLTDTEIRGTKPGPKPFKMPDRQGLFLLVNPSGSKLWRWRYQFGGRERLMALGAYPEISLSQARELHFTHRKTLASGVDPMVRRETVGGYIKERERGEVTFETVARKWWAWWRVGKAPRHAASILRRLEADMFPAFGDKPIDAVTAADIRDLMLVIEGRGARDIAKRSRETTGQVFRYALARGMVTRNPANDFEPGDILKQVKVVHRARVDTKELPELLAKIDAYGEDAMTRLAMKLMLYTFVRTSELLDAPWTEFDLDRGRWLIPAERMKMEHPHIVPLSHQAVAALRELKTLTRGGKLLFPDAEDHNDPVDSNTILFALYGMGYKGRQTGHGFRGIAATVLYEHEFVRDHIELQLAHAKQDKVEAAYNAAKYLKQRTKMMQWWADYLDANLERGKAEAQASLLSSCALARDPSPTA